MDPERSSHRDDVGRCHDLVSNIGNEMLFPVKRSRGLGSQDIRVQDDFMEISSTEKNACIKCNRSGKLLVCSERGCPISVHEKCMDCWARFDDTGNFYCPYCSYKRTLAESCRARQKAILAKKALSVFIDKAMNDGNCQKQKTGTTTNRKYICPSTVGGSNNENGQDSNAFDNQSVEFHEDLQEVAFVPKCSASNLPCNGGDESLGNNLNEVSAKICSDHARVSDCDEHRIVCGSKETTNLCETIEVNERLQAEDRGLIDENLHEGDLEDDRDAVHLRASPLEGAAFDGAVNFSTKEKPENGEGRREEEAEMKEQAQQTRVPFTCEEQDLHLHSKETEKDGVPILNFGSPMRSFAKSASKLTSTAQKEKITTSSIAIKLEKRSKKHTNEASPNSRRKKLPWSDEEEEMLKEGVQKFSTTANKNLPWRKILDFGRHVFDGTRTPVDLKDKWRNILAKESSKG